jgi:hypothetical protein
VKRLDLASANDFSSGDLNEIVVEGSAPFTNGQRLSAVYESGTLVVVVRERKIFYRRSGSPWVESPAGDLSIGDPIAVLPNGIAVFGGYQSGRVVLIGMRLDSGERVELIDPRCQGGHLFEIDGRTIAACSEAQRWTHISENGRTITSIPFAQFRVINIRTLNGPFAVLDIRKSSFEQEFKYGVVDLRKVLGSKLPKPT